MHSPIGTQYKILTAAVFALLLLSFTSVPSAAFSSPVEKRVFPDFPETVFTRRSYFEAVTGPLEEAAGMEGELVEEPGENHMIRVMSEEGEEEVKFFFAHDGDLSPEEKSMGDYELTRKKPEGSISSLKILLRDDGDTYLMLTPLNDHYSRMDIVLLGSRVQEDIRVPYTLEELMKTSFSRLMQSTSGYVDWNFYLPEPIISQLGTVGPMARAVRPYLESIGDADDGAIDADGRYVYIDDGSPQEDEKGLNCSGFAKWVVDGIYYLETEELLPIDLLKRPHPEVRGNRWSTKYEETKQPYFGLDWTRNLAVAMKRLRKPEADIESADVTDLTYHDYEEDVGYPVRRLKTLLYELAVSEPEYFYLASVNDLMHGEGELRSHFHVAVIFPWVEEDGEFQVSIMERGVETAPDEFMKRYEDAYVHLVRIKTEGAFTPPQKMLDPLLNR